MTGGTADGLVQVRCSASTAGTVELTIVVQDGWYLFPPGSTDGLPLRVTSNGADVPLRVADDDGKLRGSFVVALAGPIPDEIQLHLQACNGDQCLRPAVLPVPVNGG